jgi:predicted anti-sigma-YlaC factor YlaD
VDKAMKGLMEIMMNSCKEVSIQVTNDEGLSTMDSLKQKLHLMMCPACKKFYQQIMHLNEGINNITLKDVDLSKLNESIINKYKK